MVVPGKSVNVRTPLTSRWEAGKGTDVLPHRFIEVDLDKGSHARRNRVDICESSSRQPEATVSSPVKTRPKSLPTHEPEIRTTRAHTQVEETPEA